MFVHMFKLAYLVTKIDFDFDKPEVGNRKFAFTKKYGILKTNLLLLCLEFLVQKKATLEQINKIIVAVSPQEIK